MTGSKTTGSGVLVRPMVWNWPVSSDARDAVDWMSLTIWASRSSSSRSRARISA